MTGIKDIRETAPESLRVPERRTPEWLWVFFFILPWAVGFIAFFAYPILLAVRTSFIEMSVLAPEKVEFEGLGNWIAVATDGRFWQSIGNTAFNQAIFIPVSLASGLLLALLLFELGRGGALYRILFFIPVVTSIPVTFIIFKDLAGTSGPIQTLLLREGILSEPVNWLYSRFLPMPVIALINCWHWYGIQLIVFLGSLFSIPEETIDATKIDGASAAERWRFVMIPQIRPQLQFVLTVNLINGLQMFSEVFIMFDTDGGLYGAGLTPVLYLYNAAFTKQRMGYAVSVGLVLALIVLIVTVVQMRMTTGKGEES